MYQSLWGKFYRDRKLRKKKKAQERITGKRKQQTKKHRTVKG